MNLVAPMRIHILEGWEDFFIWSRSLEITSILRTNGNDMDSEVGPLLYNVDVMVCLYVCCDWHFINHSSGCSFSIYPLLNPVDVGIYLLTLWKLGLSHWFSMNSMTLKSFFFFPLFCFVFFPPVFFFNGFDLTKMVKLVSCFT